VDSKNKDGKTMLDDAAEGGCLDEVKAALEGVNRVPDDQGQAEDDDEDEEVVEDEKAP